VEGRREVQGAISGSARAPYFHNGSAATLGDVVEFYNERFQMELTPQERADLVAFLRAL
jgi:cytochrome c peroxidase